MTHSTLQRLTTASLLIFATLVASTGCQSSGGGSKWAWNPFSRSGGDKELVAESAPKLPTDGATPEIEGLPAAKAAPTAATLAQGETPPAVSAIAPTMEAVASAVPSINKPAPTPGANPTGWNPYPSSPTANPTATTPAAQPAPTAVASNPSGPYDPNGYKPQPPAATSVPGGDRYGVGSRYASSAPAAPESASPFGELPPATPAAPASVGDRYASTTPTTPAIPPAASPLPPTAPAAPTGDRYGQPVSTPIAAATPMTTPAATPQAEAITPPPAAGSAYPNTTVAAATPPAAPAYPATGGTTAPAATPGYPVASSAPAGSSSIGTLPPETSVYASTPITPIEPATATEPSEGAQGGSVVRLTTLPGEYRPGGTSTYPSSGAAAPAPASRY